MKLGSPERPSDENGPSNVLVKSSNAMMVASASRGAQNTPNNSDSTSLMQPGTSDNEAKHSNWTAEQVHESSSSFNAQTNKSGLLEPPSPILPNFSQNMNKRLNAANNVLAASQNVLQGHSLMVH